MDEANRAVSALLRDEALGAEGMGLYIRFQIIFIPIFLLR